MVELFCPECGADHHIADRAAEAAADREVEIARIHANRDIEVAKVTARADIAMAETDNAISAAHAEGRAEGMSDVIDGAAGDGQGDEPDGTIVIQAEQTEPEEIPEPVADLAPPVVEVPSPRERSGGGWWDGYR